MRDLEDKIVLVTGGGRGVGRAIALAFAAQRSRVVVTGRTQAALDAVREEMLRSGAHALSWPCDVAQKSQVEELDRAITQRFGAVEILINNAGIAPAAGFLEMQDSLWEETLRINLTGAYNCCKVFLPAMVASKWGRIVNIASTVSKVAYSHISAYVTSKHALLGLTRSLAVEWAKSGVTVNAVCPGYVDTELTRANARVLAEKTGKTVAEVLESLERTSPQKRLIQPEEVASLTVVLASEAAKGINGQAINVDGGAVML